MRTRRTSWWILGLAVTAALLAPTTELLAGKGGGKGGGGGDSGGGGTPAAPVITWTQYEGRTWNVKVMDADGGNPATVVQDVGTSNAHPSWSPDASEVVFTASALSGGTGIYRAAVDGSSGPTLVTSTNTVLCDPEWSPTTAPDGNEWILFHDTPDGGSKLDLYVVSPDGSTRLPLTTSQDGSTRFACWSSDASQIAAAWRHIVQDENGDNVLRYDLAVYTLGTDAAGKLTISAPVNLSGSTDSPLYSLAATAGWQDYDASWGRTADTLLVTVVETVNGKDNYDLWEVPVNAPSAAVRRTSTTESVDGSHTLGERDPCYAPDDSVAVIWRRGKGKSNSGIYTIVLEDSDVLTALVNSEDVRSPCWFRGN